MPVFNFDAFLLQSNPLCYFIVFPLVSDTAKGFDSNKTLQHSYPHLSSSQKTTCAKHRICSHLIFIVKWKMRWGVKGKNAHRALSSAPCQTVFFMKQPSAFKVPGIACSSYLLTEGCWHKGRVHPEAGNSAGIWEVWSLTPWILCVTDDAAVHYLGLKCAAQEQELLMRYVVLFLCATCSWKNYLSRSVSSGLTHRS